VITHVLLAGVVAVLTVAAVVAYYRTHRRVLLHGDRP
jgi:hypothetical protein